MEYTEVNDSLREIELKNPILNILKADEGIYNLALCQLSGTIEANDQYVKNTNQHLIKDKIKKFIELIMNNNTDLAITPEYACPWEIIEYIISSDKVPNEGKLWIFGCESISPRELRTIESRNDSVKWIYDNETLNNRGNFLNPVCFIFKTKDNNNDLKLLVLIQFKTSPMADRDTFLERDNMIKGSKIYVFRNHVGQIHLITYICSDVFNFRERDFDDNAEYFGKSILFVHLQLNCDTRNDRIKNYRNYFFNQNCDNIEVITLNWSEGTRMRNLLNGSNHSIPFNGSAIYIKSDKIKDDDETLTNNHKKGLCYTYWSNKRTNLYYVNNNESVIIMTNTKASQRAAPPASAGRTGPEVVSSYVWINSNWYERELNDGMKDLLVSCNYQFDELVDNRLCPIDKERLISISCGSFNLDNSTKCWRKVKNMCVFRVDDSQVIMRLTYTYDPNQRARRHRAETFSKYKALRNTIMSDTRTHFPEILKDLIGNAKLDYRVNDGDYVYNIYPANPDDPEKMSSPAIGSYLGNVSKEFACIMLTSILDKIGHEHFRRFVIWYLDNGNIKYRTASQEPKWTQTYTKDNSILK